MPISFVNITPVFRIQESIVSRESSAACFPVDPNANAHTALSAPQNTTTPHDPWPKIPIAGPTWSYANGNHLRKRILLHVVTPLDDRVHFFIVPWFMIEVLRGQAPLIWQSLFEFLDSHCCSLRKQPPSNYRQKMTAVTIGTIDHMVTTYNSPRCVHGVRVW